MSHAETQTAEPLVELLEHGAESELVAELQRAVGPTLDGRFARCIALGVVNEFIPALAVARLLREIEPRRRLPDGHPDRIANPAGYLRTSLARYGAPHVGLLGGD